MAELRALLAGGGTAGHVNPLLATAAELTSYGADIRVLGTAEGLEARLVPQAGLELHLVPRAPLPRRPSLEALRMPRRLRAAIAEAGAVIEESGADVMVGFGGFVATPAYIAARRRGVPIVVHEQNARPGLANRLGARWAQRVTVTFPQTPLARAELVGMPLRRPVVELLEQRAHDPAAARQRGAEALGLDPARTTLLVTGGSLGALRLNEAVTGCAQPLAERGVQVVHLTGTGKEEAVREATSQHPHYHVWAYLDDMAAAYAIADLALCRAGAGTVSELAALGIPAVYVPLPIGNGEQRRNAADVVAAGGGRIIDDAAVSPTALEAGLLPLLEDPAVLATMAERAAAAGIRDGARRLAAVVAEAAHR